MAQACSGDAKNKIQIELMDVQPWADSYTFIIRPLNINNSRLFSHVTV